MTTNEINIHGYFTHHLNVVTMQKYMMWFVDTNPKIAMEVNNKKANTFAFQ